MCAYRLIEISPRLRHHAYATPTRCCPQSAHPIPARHEPGGTDSPNDHQHTPIENHVRTTLREKTNIETESDWNMFFPIETYAKDSIQFFRDCLNDSRFLFQRITLNLTLPMYHDFQWAKASSEQAVKLLEDLFAN